ncbi:D(1A) dopamine receptor-like [Montipora capricornis]|uniref:D(1A) dopamine receptor-like n=1 Tax=Montipora foliosa TaxID=591990 RepID=UPI0035F1964F
MAASTTSARTGHEINANDSLSVFARNTTKPSSHDMKDPLNILSFSFLLLIITATLVGNSLVILAFKRNAKIRTKTNYFVVSLAVADILVALVSMPIWAAYLMAGVEFNQGLLKIWTFMDILCGVASIINLTAISIERYFCISYPLHYHTTMTSRKAITTIIIIWIFSIIMSSLKIILWTWPPPNYELMIVISCFFIPLIIMCVTYRFIFKVARYQARQIALMINGNVQNFLLASEMRAAKTLAVVMGAFVISWGPFFIINMVWGFCTSCITIEAVVVTKWMHYTNSLFNPIVYACMNKEFRKAFCNILFGRKRCCRTLRGGRGDLSTDQTDLSLAANMKD